MNKFHFIIYFFLIISCKSPQKISDPIPEHDTLKITSKLLQEERVINIWLPQEYKNSGDSLIVLYMPDGGIKEDFPHIANTLKELFEKQEIPPIMLVGIENTVRRRDLTSITESEKDKELVPNFGGSTHFRKFIQEELMPQINQKYNTLKKTGIIGESLAGYFVMESFLTQPESFDFYIAFDPSLWWNDQYLVNNASTILPENFESPKTLWFAGSKAEDISPYVKNLAKTLENKNITSLKWHFSDEPQEEHHTIFRATKEKALIWTLNNL